MAMYVMQKRRYSTLHLGSSFRDKSTDGILCSLNWICILTSSLRRMALHRAMLERHRHERLERAETTASNLVPEEEEAMLDWLQANAGCMILASPAYGNARSLLSSKKTTAKYIISHCMSITSSLA